MIQPPVGARLSEQLEGAGRPGQALITWLAAYVEHVSSRRGLGAAMMTGRAEDTPRLPGARHPRTRRSFRTT